MSSPSGKIILRLKTNKQTGHFEAKIVGHEGSAKCSDNLDEALLRDLLESDIGDFGNMAEIEDSSKTSEYFEEKRGKKHSCKEAPFGEEEEETPKKQKDLSLGFGV